MYKKIIIASEQKPVDHHNILWLKSKRLNTQLKDDRIILNNDVLLFSKMDDVGIYKYKSFLFLNISSIFYFKYLDKYYQIGINNQDLSKVSSYFKNINYINQPLKIKDYAFSLIIISFFIWLIYNFSKM